MKKLKVKLIGLKLDLKIVEQIELIMERLKIRSYTQVIKYCLFSEVSLNQYYQYSKGISPAGDNEQQNDKDVNHLKIN